MSSYLDKVVAGYVDELNSREAKKAWLRDPARWAKERLSVELWWKQKEVCQSIVNNGGTAVKAGVGVGKSFLAAVLVCWWIDVHPINRVYVATTAPNHKLISTVLWREIKRLHQDSHKAAKEDKTGLTKPLPGYITMDNKWKDDLGNLLAEGQKPPDDKAAENFAGIHDGFVLAIGDEACGLVPDMIAGLQRITTNRASRRLLIGNPTNPGAHFATLFKNDASSWSCHTISVLELPTFHGGGKCKCHPKEKFGYGLPEEVLGKMSSPEYVEDIINDYGEGSPEYQSRVLGEFAWDQADILFDGWTLARGQDTVVEPDVEEPYRVLGVDVARRDADSTYIYMVEWGEVHTTRIDAKGNVKTGGVKKNGEGLPVRGKKLRHVDHWKNVSFVDRTDYNTGQVTEVGQARRLDEIARRFNVKEVRVDASGMGDGLLDPLYELCRNDYAIIEIRGGTPSSNRSAYLNMRAEQYDLLRREMFQGKIDVDENDDLLLTELGGIHKEFADGASGGGLKIESKESMKKRGVKSPDAADAAWYAVADFSYLLDGQYAGMNAGDVVRADLEEFAPSSFHEYSW